jgi:hypothetical protein
MNLDKDEYVIKCYKKGKTYYVFGSTFIVVLIWILLEILYNLFIEHSLIIKLGPPVTFSYTSKLITSLVQSITIVPIVFYFINLSSWNKITKKYSEIMQNAGK